MAAGKAVQGESGQSKATEPGKSKAAGRERLPVPLGHLALLVVAGLPAVVPVPENLNIVLTAVLAVFVGSWRSVKPEAPTDSMSQKDAMRFPIIGSCVLFGLFILFKVLPKDLVNAVLTLYFAGLGMLALTACALPFIEAALPPKLRERSWSVTGLRIPLVKEPVDLGASLPEVVGGAGALAVTAWYCATKHWLANNALGLAFSLTGIEHLSLGALSTGLILLSGLFVYDIFWVFCTPVMVTVAKSFEAPIKLLFPRAAAAATGAKLPFAMLGLGDIVIPGIFVALLLRYDAKTPSSRANYFYSAFGGYVVGLATTIVVMNVFQAAQPALLYIVPAVIGAVGVHAALRGEFSKMLWYSEEPKEKTDEKASVAHKDAAKTKPAITIDDIGKTILQTVDKKAQ